MRIRLIPALCAALACSAVGFTAPPAVTNTRPRVSDLAWMAGTWRSSEGDKVAEEIWSEPSAGTMIGMFRQTSPGKKPLFEFLVMEEDDQGVTKRFKHYFSGFADMEKEPLTLKVTELTKNKVVFQATGDGKLKSIVYTREGDRMDVKVNTTRENKPHLLAITMERVTGK